MYYLPRENLENVSGIPDFWLTIFKNTQMLSEMIQEADEPILKHLIDVKVIFLNEPMVSAPITYFDELF